MRNFSLIMCLAGLLLSCNNGSGNKITEQGVHLSNGSASHEAKDLYNILYASAQKGFLVGHQDALAYGMGWKDQGFDSDIFKVTGDFPALFGWDLGHINDDVNIDSVPFNRMKEWAIEVDKRGGINSYGWHALNLSSGASSWDTTSSVVDILPTGKHHEIFLSKLDLVAGFFKDLQRENGELIPVIFRPWHEMNGSWFWWGAGNCSIEEYKALWIFTYHYFTEKHQLNNMLWCYSTDVFNTANEYLTYYPGDEYVDILGFDDYKGVKSEDRFNETINRFKVLNKLAKQKQKIYALSETGSNQVLNPTWFTEILNGIMLQDEHTMGAAYLLFWRNGRPDHFYTSYPSHASEANFVKFAEHPSTLFLTDLNQLKAEIEK